MSFLPFSIVADVAVVIFDFYLISLSGFYCHCCSFSSFYVALGLEPSTSCMLSGCSEAELQFQSSSEKLHITPAITFRIELWKILKL